ncbi:antibiotic biosynthesis monooxygenase [Actinomadura algeriensis]|uniref:Quinol monooxygenase YgiN n=1 Tax=Actinomadura algeriensis TaxID=1679523 RepID=A0ABR9JMA8_9ACTN|nr:antibiotic biosynthesis monooxygenase [Actinomadura algeriensis]MBE1531698.1 quinol monooxygenase YgiN [Actinomadura algeriensis]
MVSALFALLAAGGALYATWLLVSRAYKDRLLYLIAWSFTQVGLSLALLAMTVGFLAGFNGLFFRVAEIGAALLAPLWLMLGMIELIARFVQVRFGAWLFTISYTVVAVVILLLDPLKGDLGKSLPKPGDTYDALPLLLIDGAHLVSTVSLVGCTAFTAWMASKRDREAGELMIPVALVALAGVLAILGTRGLLPGPVAVILLGGAAGLVWYGAMRTIPVYDDEDDFYDDDFDGDYVDEPATGYEEPFYEGRRRAAAEQPVPAPTPPADNRPPGGRRGELRFPEQQAEELRFPEPSGAQALPESPAGATAVDGLDDSTLAAAAAMAAGTPGGMGAPVAPLPGPRGTGASGLPGGDLSAACGQITVYTLLDGREDVFDRLAADLVQAARAAEPDTVVCAVHEVVGSSTQRILYQLFRNEAAFNAHQRQPHLKRFLSETRTHVLATNVIELRLGAHKVPLPGPAPERPRR